MRDMFTIIYSFYKPVGLTVKLSYFSFHLNYGKKQTSEPKLKCQQKQAAFHCYVNAYLFIFLPTSAARILQRWGEGVENDVTFDHTLYTGADAESFSGGDLILN